MSVLTTFRAVAPEFADTADALIDTLTDVVSAGLDAETFGARMSLACAYLVAHELTMQDRAANGGGVGAVTSIRTGDLSAGFGGSVNQGNADDALRQTTHGLAFLAIRNSRSNISFGIIL